MFASPSTMNRATQTLARQKERSNQLWLDELRGKYGENRQQQAYSDLANYLYKVAYNYLLRRQNDIPLLAMQMSTELAMLAQDSAQDTLAKICADNAALLDQYEERGRFLGWMALIIRNHIAGNLRRSPYSREVPLPPTLVGGASTETPIINRLTLAEIGIELQHCINALPPARREAFVRCIVQGQRSKTVAAQLHRTPNAVDQLVMHAKRQLKECLQTKGITEEILHLFDRF